MTSLDDYLKCQLHLARPVSYSKAAALACFHEPNYLAWKVLWKGAILIKEMFPNKFKKHTLEGQQQQTKNLNTKFKLEALGFKNYWQQQQIFKNQQQSLFQAYPIE